MEVSFEKKSTKNSNSKVNKKINLIQSQQKSTHSNKSYAFVTVLYIVIAYTTINGS